MYVQQYLRYFYISCSVQGSVDQISRLTYSYLGWALLSRRRTPSLGLPFLPGCICICGFCVLYLPLSVFVFVIWLRAEDTFISFLNSKHLLYISLYIIILSFSVSASFCYDLAKPCETIVYISTNDQVTIAFLQQNVSCCRSKN